MGKVIDGIHIIVSDKYASMKKKDAVDDMLNQGFVPGSTEKDKKSWAEKAYDLINPSTEKSSPQSEKE